MAVEDTLKARGATYGEFEDVAGLSQALQNTMRGSRNWDSLVPDQREALQTIASKIARILNGDQNHVDSWHDIGGYAALVERRLTQPRAGNGNGLCVDQTVLATE